MIFFDKTSRDSCMVKRYVHHTELYGKRCIVFSQSLRVPQRVTPVSCKKRMEEDEKIVNNCVRSLLFHELITFWVMPWVVEKIRQFYIRNGDIFGGLNPQDIALRYTSILARFYEIWYAIHLFDTGQVAWYLENSYEMRRRDALV
tara:strand:- start:2996 stop:3430 length:435 start_codon:yes stop_codon:yes gene_type:complete